MRSKLISARKLKKISIAEISALLNISERMYRYIEQGTRNGNYEIWDTLEDLFEIPQRQLREISPQKFNL